MAAQRKPNLVLFLPDQQRADTIACYGGAKVHAPNLNKLASESVVFERAYVTQPVCTPSPSDHVSDTCQQEWGDRRHRDSNREIGGSPDDADNRQRGVGERTRARQRFAILTGRYHEAVVTAGS